MKLSKLDMFVIAGLMDSVSGSDTKIKTQLNLKGVKRLAKIKANIGASLLDINAKDIIGVCEEQMLKSLDYQKED